MKKRLISDPVKSHQLRIFCLVLFSNFTLFLGLMSALASISDNPESARLFGGAALVAALETAWLGFSASRSRIFLNYQRATRVYYPGMAISLLLAFLTQLMIKFNWSLQSPSWILVFAAGLFMVICLGIKLSNSRHALD